jgi:HTH-type transcriptional regulator / antitoxin HigA
MSIAPTPSSYADLLAHYLPRVIHSEREHRQSLCNIDKLMAIESPSKDEQNILDLLVEIVERYEERKHPTPDLSPNELLAHLIEVRDITKAELARSTGICRSSITDIVAGRRQISKASAVKLSDYFGVNPSLFIR